MTAIETLTAFNVTHDYGTTDADLYGTLNAAKRIFSELNCSYRWWDEEFRVVEIDGILYGYCAATTTGDASPRDLGWEFDPSSICFVEPYTVSVTRYKVKE